MARPTTHLAEQILDCCRENLDSLTQAFNSCLDLQCEMSVGPLSDLDPENIPDEPGLAVLLQLNGQGMACLIPECPAFRDWYRSPNASQDARLQTLGMEWSVVMVPPECEVSGYSTMPVDDLRAQIQIGEPVSEAAVFELLLSSTGGGPDRILVVAPVALAQLTGTRSAESLESRVAEPTADSSGGPEFRVSDRRSRLLPIPVPVVVQIASKKIDLAQLRAFSPGMLLTFNKSCESLLDVFVANRLYCRGEAVKVGENFGVKIHEVDARVVREPRVHQM